MAYERPVYSTYTLPAATISSAATLLRIVGPKGMTGVLAGISAVITTEATGSDTELRVGVSGDADKFGTLTVPASAVGTAHNGADLSPADENLLPVDTTVLIATDGGGTAGAADIAVTVGWFKATDV